LGEIVVLDYSLGNLMSITKALESLGQSSVISNEAKAVREAIAIILPGVGAFQDAMKNISPIREDVVDAIKGGKPALGICLGLQLLFTESTEGGLRHGLDFWKGRVERLPTIVKVPQIGWNTVNIRKPDQLMEGLNDCAYAYFVHSYYGNPSNKKMVVAETDYGVTLPSIISEKNIYATQFHPEKSGKFGLAILKNFINIMKR
jgi:imidazole glycerol-phosphate synthase subunit HisH